MLTPSVTYRSNVSAPDLEPCFERARDMTKYRNAPGHRILCDPDLFAGCGYVTHDEAAILYRTASRIGGRWLEIGSHTGWSTAHIALGASTVYALEPEFIRPVFNDRKDPAVFFKVFSDNIARVRAAYPSLAPVDPIPHLSQNVLPLWDGPKFSGCFIDGEHMPPFPQRDAEMLLPHLAADAVVVFHDVLGEPVQDGVKHLVDHGFSWRLYRTPQLLAVCWRGRFTPIDHTPDPAFDWAAFVSHLRVHARIGVPEQ